IVASVVAVVVEVTIRDAKGFGIARAENLARFKVTGRARILGVGNGDPSSHEPDIARQRHAFNGKCLVLIQSTAKAGPVTLTAESDGLVAGVVTLAGSRGGCAEESVICGSAKIAELVASMSGTIAYIDIQQQLI
ncbi:MAG: hypothetical protein ABJA67_05060, partial [Chthonomonadales bacterium]